MFSFSDDNGKKKVYHTYALILLAQKLLNDVPNVLGMPEKYYKFVESCSNE